MTKVQGSALGKSGSAHEMLGKVPGMMMRGENLEVIGKGTPVFYINGRKLYDFEELKRMRSEEVLKARVPERMPRIECSNRILQMIWLEGCALWP